MNITKKDGAYNLIDTIFAPIKKNKEVLGMSSWFHKFISFFLGSPFLPSSCMRDFA